MNLNFIIFSKLFQQKIQSKFKSMGSDPITHDRFSKLFTAKN